MEKILLIDACVRKDSRTRLLAEYLLGKLSGQIEKISLAEEGILPLNEQRLQERDRAIADKDKTAPILKYAHQFAEADKIIIAAPHWDLGFPAVLKNYLEAVTVAGVTFLYDETGRPRGLCRAKELIYVATSGGKIFTEEYGYGYVRSLCNAFYGIEKTRSINAEGLDIFGADVSEILERAKIEIDRMFEE